ncbi:MAG: hypothetical protein AAGC81_08620 [Pseudomonadota bacterium]
MRFTYVLPLIFAAGSACAEPVSFLTHAGQYTIDWSPARQTLEIESPDGTGSYDVTGCVFGRRNSGVFALYLKGLDSPHVVQHCETESGDRLSIYAPRSDPKFPVFEIYSHRVHYRLGSDHLNIDAIDPDRRSTFDWKPTGVIRGSESPEVEIRRLPDPLAARRQGLAILDRQVRTPSERSVFLGEDASWSGWDRLLRGGWASERSDNGEQAAFLPADLANWPSELDRQDHLYGDKAGAQLRVAPQSSAPAIRLIHRVILSPGPGIEGEEAIEASGWLHVCSAPNECGFVRAEDVRTADGSWALFSRSGRQAAWKLERLHKGGDQSN